MKKSKDVSIGQALKLLGSMAKNGDLRSCFTVDSSGKPYIDEGILEDKLKDYIILEGKKESESI